MFASVWVNYTYVFLWIMEISYPSSTIQIYSIGELFQGCQAYLSFVQINYPDPPSTPRNIFWHSWALNHRYKNHGEFLIWHADIDCQHMWFIYSIFFLLISHEWEVYGKEGGSYLADTWQYPLASKRVILNYFWRESSSIFSWWYFPVLTPFCSY